MPQLNDDAIYIGNTEAQFASAASKGDTASVTWTFTIASGESFTAYDPSHGLVPSEFVLQGANLSSPSGVAAFYSVNFSGAAGVGVTAGISISGVVHGGDPAQIINIPAVYVRTS